MENVVKDVASTFQYLLPGFLAAWVFYGLTSYSKPDQFERAVQALVFTVIVKACVVVESQLLFAAAAVVRLGEWTSQSELVWSVCTAFLIGLGFSWLANNDGFHGALRRFGVTRETSFPSEWYGAFLKDVTYVVLHLIDERRLYGWPREWPSDPGRGFFSIEQPSWILPDGKEQHLPGVGVVLVNVKDVRWVEFMQKTWEDSDEEKL